MIKDGGGESVMATVRMVTACIISKVKSRRVVNSRMGSQVST